MPIGSKMQRKCVLALHSPIACNRSKPLLRCESIPPALWARNANLIKKTMNSEAVFGQLKKFRKSSLNSQADWLAGWMDGSHKNKNCHAAVATAQKLVLRRDMLIPADLLKQKLEGRKRRHEEAKSSSNRPCTKAPET